MIRIEEELVVNNKTIDARILSRMFLAGAKNLEAKKEWINELNVFPVPDGDTGTNMTMTIMSAAREVGALSNPTRRFLPVLCAVQEVTQVLFFLSFCVVLPEVLRTVRNWMPLISRQPWRKVWRLHIRQS